MVTTRGRRLPVGFWKGSSGKSKSKSAKAVRSIAPRVRKAMTAIATRVVKRKSETKWAATHAITNQTLYGDIAPVGAPVQVYPAICPVQVVNAAGTNSDNTRVGNQIMPTKCSADLLLSIARTPTTGGTIQDGSFDITAHIWYGYVKRYKNATDILVNQNDIANQLLDLGGAGPTQFKRFSGLLQDLQFPLNKEYFNMKHKTVRLYKSYGSVNTMFPLAAGVTQYFPDRTTYDMKLSFKAPKTLKYSEADEPENFCPVVIIGYAHNDNTQAANGVVNQPSLTVDMVTKIWFKDE